MIYYQYQWDDLSVKVRLSKSESKPSASEFHAMLELTDTQLTGREQFNRIDKAIERLKNLKELTEAGLVWKRYFVSDAANQGDWVKVSSGEAVSVIQQPPLNGTKIALWAYFVEHITCHSSDGGTVVMKRPAYSFLFNTCLYERKGNSYEQTQSIFNQYIHSLHNQHCTLEENCLRTWLFVRDVDTQYEGMVRARKELFADLELTPQTHFIASTGIEGRYVFPETLITMDAFAIPEIKKEQITYLQGSSNLNPTHEYGVTFERGVSIQFGDRRHIFISGTASIDNKGQVIYPLDIEKQTERTLENVRVLLAEAGAGFRDIAHLIVYLRDVADYETAKRYLDQHHPELPAVILWAPVCRPGWLIEVECMAVKEIKDNRFAEF